MTVRYNEDLDPNEGPGLGCFTVQAILFAAILLLIPVGLFSWGWPVWLLATLLFVDLVLLFFVSMTSVFLLRVFFAERRRGRGRQVGVARPSRPPLVVSTDQPAASDEPAEDRTDEPTDERGDR
ncbi:MAG TPA: hypothetical protein VFM19_07740 [Candidatus Limnocylindria bacterium]|nr:hypothetical protein [Candidatus Limnocylindria bacterium]